MNMQTQILKKYFEIYGMNLTLKQISQHVGIQVTRVFRIQNGYEMKVSEYERFKAVIQNDNPNFKQSLVKTALKGEELFSVKIAKEVEDLLNMKIRLYETIAG